MRKLSEKLEGGKRYIIHPDYKIGLNMLNEWIEECKELEKQVENLNIGGVVDRVCRNSNCSENNHLKHLCLNYEHSKICGTRRT